VTGTGRLALEGLTVVYDDRAALSDVNGSFEPGSMTAIVGPNGAGKSTLVKSLVGLVRPAAGRVLLQDLTGHDLAYLPQAADIDRSFPIAVADLVAMGAWREAGAFRRFGPDVRSRTADALETVGLGGLGRRPIGALSVGQFQRVLFARLLLQNAPVIVLDEPFTAVDARTTADLLVLLQRWQAEGRTLIAVLHDLEQVRSHFPQAVLLARRQIAWGPTEEVLSPVNLRRARSAAEHWDDLDLAA
jgi:zinc/manganese transport system ATP-binding protein